MRQLILIFLLFISANLFAQDTATTQSIASEHVAVEASSSHAKEHTKGGQEEKASPVDVIMHHVADANHIEVLHHVYFPLPCIIYNKKNGKLDIFMSSKLAHNKEYNGYVMHHDRVVPINGEKSDIIDFSITKNVFTMLLGVLLLTLAFSIVVRRYKRDSNVAPKGFQALFEPIFLYIYEDVIKQNLGKKADKYAPYLFSLFFFILIINLLGLIPFFPGGANASGNISFTAVLAVCTFLVITLNGNKHYWHHIFAMPGVPKWVLVILTPVEIAGMFVKPFALAMRLFGNITSGHVVILSLVSLIFILGKNGESLGGAFAGTAMAVPFVLFMSALELLVAFLQAYIFTLLSAIFISSAVAEDEHH